MPNMLIIKPTISQPEKELEDHWRSIVAEGPEDIEQLKSAL